MRIVFVVPADGVSPTGGFRIIAGYADRLQARGHETTIIAPGGARTQMQRFATSVSNIIDRLGGRRSHDAAPFLKNPDVRIITAPNKNTLAPDDFPDADILVATWWETAEWIARAPDNIGKLHFVQDHEIFPYLPVERARAAYRLPLEKIVVSQWLRDQLREAYGVEPAIIENAIEFEEFNRGPRAKPERPTVGFVYSAALRKNSQMAIDACRRLRASHPDLRVVSFGSHKPRREDGMPPWVEFRLRPPSEDIAALYGGCDVWLFTSDEEGFGLPMLEAMAAGTPVVATPAGAAPQLIDGENGRLATHDAADVAATAARIVSCSSDTWRVMSEAATRTARARNWVEATDRFEAALISQIR